MADIGAIYKFIQQTNVNSWDDWAKKAALDGDGYLIKAEFEKWIAGKFNENVVDEFWYAVDINRSAARIEGTDLKNLHAITKDEMARMEAVVNQAEFLNGLVITAPNELHPSLREPYVTDVTRELTDEFNKFSQGKLSASWTVEEAYDRIQTKYSQEYILRDLQEYEYAEKLNTIGYSFSEDKAIIDELFSKCLKDSSIKERIASHARGTDDGVMEVLKEVLLNFMANANIVNVSNKTIGYEGWSVLQEKALAHKIQEQSLNDPAYNEILKDDAYVNELAVQGYAYDFLHNSTSYDDAEANIYNEFINDPEKQIAGIKYYFNDIIKKQSDALINNATGELFSKIEDIEEGGVLTDLYLSSYGDKIRDKVQTEILDKVEDGTISTDIKTEVINGLYYHVEELFQTENDKSGYVKFESVDGYGYEYLNNLHDARVDVITKQTTEAANGNFQAAVVYGGNSTLKAVFNAFEQYCAALRNMGSVYKDAVDYVESALLTTVVGSIGDNIQATSKTFKAAFNDMLDTLDEKPDNATLIDSAIYSWTQNIRKFVGDTVKMYSFKLNRETFVVDSGSSMVVEDVCSGIVMPDGSIQKPNGGYKLTTNPATADAAMNRDGRLTFKAPVVSSSTPFEVTIEAIINGTAVTKTLEVTVNPKPVSDVLGACDTPTSTKKPEKNGFINYNNDLLTDYSLKDLYEQDCIIKLANENCIKGNATVAKQKSLAEAPLNTAVDNIIKILKTAGLKSEYLDTIAVKVKASYMNNMSSDWDYSFNANLKNEASFEKCWEYSVTQAQKAGKRDQVVGVRNQDGANQDDFVFVVSFKGIVDTILDEYKNLNGGL